jgi:two-component system phosphate regulon response regulator PhoB
MNAAPGTRILVVEDEPDIAALVAYQLAQAGHQVRTSASGREAIRALETDPPDLVILDLMLPEMSGLDVLRTLRGRKETKDLPVIVLTARREESDRVRGLELGADDYVAKPFSPRELVLRAEAVLRRASGGARAGGGRRLRGGPITLDVEAHRVTVDGREVALTPTEHRLLLCLMERRGRTQSRDALLEAVWETAAEIETRTVDMHIRRLRSKLGGPAADLIETVRGFGYRFRRED